MAFIFHKPKFLTNHYRKDFKTNINAKLSSYSFDFCESFWRFSWWRLLKSLVLKGFLIPNAYDSFITESTWLPVYFQNNRLFAFAFQPPVKKSTKSPVKATKPEKSPSKPPAATKGDTLLILDDCKSNMSSCNYW